MDRKDVDKISLGEGGAEDSVDQRPRRFSVIGLPDHLTAKVDGTHQSGYRFKLRRTGDVLPYEQNQGSRTPELALRELKRLLNWDPPETR